MKIFITGASGMVGQNLVESALSKNHELVTPSRSEIDLLDAGSVQNYIGKVKPDFIIHAAGHVGGIQSNIKNKSVYLQLNLQMGLNVLQAAYSNGVERVMNLGSSCMYPRGSQDAIAESKILTGELEPTNEGYALAKIAVSKYAEYLSLEHGLKYKTVIPCNLYGRWDKFDPAHSHLIPAIILKIHRAIQEGLTEIDVWGTGEARREFMYAGDLASYVCKLVEKFDELPGYLNIGLGYDYSVNDYYRVVAKILKFDGKFKHDLKRPEGMKRKLVDISKLREAGIHFDIGLVQGIEKTYEFFKQHQI